AALAIGLIDAGVKGWSSTTVLVCLATFLAGTALFIVVERRARPPMLPLALFSSSTFSAATVVGFLCNLGFFGELFVMSLYLQQERGLSALTAGFVLAPQMAATMLGSVLSGRVMAGRGPRRPMLVGLGIGSVGLLSLALAGLRTPYWLLLPSVTLAGFGIAFTMMPATAAVIETAGEGRGGVASGSLNAARQLGGMVGVALLGSFVAGGSGFLGGFRIDMILAAGAFAIALAVSGAFVDRVDGRACGRVMVRSVGRP
ncbi:MAG: MFS transporter, partial [Actinomycetota bacterium]|nr:MFS transporter [Actinomycetota bacterium]